jgi:chromosome segregation ATPase
MDKTMTGDEALAAIIAQAEWINEQGRHVANAGDYGDARRTHARADRLRAAHDSLSQQLQAQAAEVERLSRLLDVAADDMRRKDSLIEAAEGDAKRLREALNGLLDNSSRADWPADLYDAAINAVLTQDGGA